jgi:preprotein translocase subunit YajC
MPGLFESVPVLFAQNAPAGGAGANQAQAIWTFLPYVAIIALWFYLLLIRPQQKQEKHRRDMLSALKKNDKVLTSAGIYGTVVSVDSDDDRVVLRVDDDRGVKVAFSKTSIVRVFDGSPDRDKNKEKEKATEPA